MKVRFVRVFRDAVTGAQYSPGQGAAFSDAFARDLIDRGIATRQEDAMPIPKTLDRPTRDKMVSAPPKKKGAV